MAQRSVIEVGPRGGQRVGRYMGKDGKLHWVYLGSGGAGGTGGGSGLEHGSPAPDGAPAEEHRAPAAHETHGHVHKDPRIPPVGTQRTTTYKGQQHTVTVTAEGFRYEGNGRQYRSLSQLANELADSRQNGLRFFGLHEDSGVDRRRKEPAEGEADPKARRTVALSPAGQQSAQDAAQREAAGPPPRTVALAPGAGQAPAVTETAPGAPQAPEKTREAPPAVGGTATATEPPAAPETPEKETPEKPPASSAASDDGGPTTYGGQNRPLGFGSVPSGHSGFGEHPNFRHGTVTYPKALSDEDARSYQLTRIAPEGEHGALADKVADGMKEYASEYVELGQDDPKAYQQGIRQHVERHLHETNTHADVEALAGEVQKRIEAHAAGGAKTAPAGAAPLSAEEPVTVRPRTPATGEHPIPPPPESEKPAAATGEWAADKPGDRERRDFAKLIERHTAPHSLRRVDAAALQEALASGDTAKLAEAMRALPETAAVGPLSQALRSIQSSERIAEGARRAAGGPGAPTAAPEQPARTNPDEVTGDEQAQRQAAAEESARRRRKPGEPEGPGREPAAEEAPAAPAPPAAETGSQAPTVQEPPPAEAPKPSAPAPQAESPTVQQPQKEQASPSSQEQKAPEALPEPAPARRTGNEEERQGNLAPQRVSDLEAALKPHAARVEAAKDPGERLKALTAEYTARSEHGRQLAGMEGPEARQAVERNRGAMGQLNAEIGKLRGQGAGEKPAPPAAPAESQAELTESRGRLSAPGPERKPKTVVTLQGAQNALEGARRRTDLTPAAHKAASAALEKGDFTAAREALAKGSTERYRKTALEYVDRLEDAATGKSGVERAADRELAGTAPPPTPDRRLPVAEAAALAGLAPAKKPAPAAESPKAAPPSPQEAAAKATPGEYNKAIADHAAAHLSAAEEQAKAHVERILEKVGGAAALGEGLVSDPERRARSLGKWAAHVYDKMGPDLEAAGLEPHAARGIIRHTLERSTWHPEARAALLAHISGKRGKKLAPAAATIGDGAENLAGGDETRAGHVQQSVDIYDSDWKALAQKGEVATARVVDLVSKAAQANTPEARQQAQRALAEALGPLMDLARVQDAYPGFQDRAVQPARDALAAVSTLGRTEPTRDGAATPLFLQGENGRAQRMQARYRLVEAGDVTPSHDPFSFAKNAAYPEGVQEREYHSDESDRAKVIKQAQGLTPEFMVNTNPDAVNGPPMVLPNGVVLGGNSRAMSLHRAYENHPEVAAAYRAHLSDTAAHFGFTAADVGALKRPMLVRTVETADQSNEALARLGHQMNAGFTQAMNPAAEQVSLGKQLRQPTLDLLATAMQPDDSLPDFLDSAGSQGFVDALKKDGAFTERNENQYFDRNKKLNEDGKARVARILMGRVVGDPDAIRNAPPSLVESVARIVPTLMQADAAGERYSLGKALKTALDGHTEIRRFAKGDATYDGRGTKGALSGKSDEKHWQRAWDHLQGGLEARMGAAHPAATDPAARELVQVLVKRSGPRQIVPVFEEYARLAKEKGSAGQADFLGGSPEGAGELLQRAVRNVEAREGEQKETKAATKAEKEAAARAKVIEEHERAKAAAAAPTPEPAPAPPPDPEQAAAEQDARDRAEATRNQTSFL